MQPQCNRVQRSSEYRWRREQGLSSSTVDLRAVVCRKMIDALKKTCQDMRMLHMACHDKGESDHKALRPVSSGMSATVFGRHIDTCRGCWELCSAHWTSCRSMAILSEILMGHYSPLSAAVWAGQYCNDTVADIHIKIHISPSGPSLETCVAASG